MSHPFTRSIGLAVALLLAPTAGAAAVPAEPPLSIVSVAAYHRALPRLQRLLERRALDLGAPLFIRIFKQSSELEVWLQDADGRFELFKTYAICHYSGTLGPKEMIGDLQSPEGFYRVAAAQMNPWSSNHLSFNLGYPNDYDRMHGRSGSALMVHGGCTSSGCYAMTDYHMDEIYTLADAALARGQTEFQVHIFPFRMTPEQLDRHRRSPWYPFWSNLRRGYDLFERHRLPPLAEALDNRYVFRHHYDPAIARIDF